MPATRIYRNTTPPPMYRGPHGYGQYSIVVTAMTKAEAARLAGLDPKHLEWERSTGWLVLRALDGAGLLGIPGQVYVVGVTQVDRESAYLKSGDGWEAIGRLRYTDGSMVLDPA